MRKDLTSRGMLGASALCALAAGAALAVGGGAPTQHGKLDVSTGELRDGHGFGYSIAVSGDTVLGGAYDYQGRKGTAYVFRRTGTLWAREAMLSAADGAPFDDFGLSVGISGDTAVVGATKDGSDEAAAYVFTRSGSVWTQEAKLVAADPEASGFGAAVAISGDTVLVGAYGSGPVEQGAAYVFRRTGTTWTQEAKLLPSDPEILALFGASVAIEGDTAVLGAPNTENAAYVFTRTGTTWTQEARLTSAHAETFASFGYSVALAGDAAVVGAISTNSEQGSAYIFRRTGTTWAEEAELVAPVPANNDRFGSSVGIVGDTALVGALQSNSARGAAYVFTRTGTTWTRSSNLVPADPARGDQFGHSIAVDGDSAVVTALDSHGVVGSAYVFSLSGAALPPGYCLPTRVVAKTAESDLSKSTLVASGILDTGEDAPDFSGPATFDFDGLHLDIPAFVPKGRSLVYGAGGITLTIAPATNGSSHAAFTVHAVGDVTGKVAANRRFLIRFTNATHDLRSFANLTWALRPNGEVRDRLSLLGPRGIDEPFLGVRSAVATIRGGGRDSLKLVLSFVSGREQHVETEDLTFGFGNTYTAAFPAASFVVRGVEGGRFVHAAEAPGITKATVDYLNGTITIVGHGLDLGAFAAGVNDVVVTIKRGSDDTRSVRIRMSLAGTKLTY